MPLSKGAATYVEQLAKLKEGGTELAPSDVLILELITVLYDQRGQILELQNDLEALQGDFIDLVGTVTSS